MILGIVGPEKAKFTHAGFHRAIAAINRLIDHYQPKAISSGGCHLGGVDIWAEAVAKKAGCFDEKYIFLPKELKWKTGFEPRNIQIATASDVVVTLAVNRYHDEYAFEKFPCCYHCKRWDKSKSVADRGLDHVKGGGCWTRWYAHRLGKETRIVIIEV
jgi:hypothetical protein